jgi:peroxiredoxin
VTFATPGYCTSQLCAPVVDTVDAVYKQYQDQANFIHIEVYKTFDPLVYADEMAEWGLTSEPWTFVLDKDGKVSARFNGPLGKEELVSALEPLLP